jgi:hypothetical protein
MTDPRPDHRLLAAARMVENFAARLPVARLHIRQQINAIDGWLGDNGDPHVTHTAELTTVEAAVETIRQLENTLADLEAHAKAIPTITHNAFIDCDNIIGHRTIEVRRCTATGRDGAIEWADPTCRAVASRGPLCDRCSKREYRWRITHGLTPRSDGVYSNA